MTVFPEVEDRLILATVNELLETFPVFRTCCRFEVGIEVLVIFVILPVESTVTEGTEAELPYVPADAPVRDPNPEAFPK
jgi:hypothetical protein